VQENEIANQLSQIQEQLHTLTQRIDRLEDKILLVSDVDRYQQLQTYLASQRFREADAENHRLILDTLSTDSDSLTPDDMSRFPCSVFKVLDRLWRHYSGDRFGFSIQLQAYMNVGGSIDTLRTQDSEVIQKFAEQVGWYKEGAWQGSKYEDWDFSSQAPRGCFPALWWKSPYGFKMVSYCFMRLLSCELTPPTSP
jgi:hypothetical protein